MPKLNFVLKEDLNYMFVVINRLSSAAQFAMQGKNSQVKTSILIVVPIGEFVTDKVSLEYCVQRRLKQSICLVVKGIRQALVKP